MWCPLVTQSQGLPTLCGVLPILAMGGNAGFQFMNCQGRTPGSEGEAAGAPVNMGCRKAEQDWAGFGRTAACVGAGPLAQALGEAAAPRSCPVIKPAQQIGQGVRLTMKYDGLTAEAAGVTCFQTLHLEVIILLDASYNL